MLSPICRFLLAPSFALLALLASCAAASESKPTPKQIVQWIEQLGDNDFKMREAASKKLWQAGAAAESSLENALKSDDREVVRRARELLDKFRWGIYPDTPADIIALIRAYQSRGAEPRMEVLQKLLDGGETGLRAALKIATAENDANRRNEMNRLFANKLPKAFVRAATEDKFEHFERLLEVGHAGKFIAAKQYAVYWLLRNRLPESIAHFRARLNEHPDDKGVAQTLAYLHRANGDLTQARKAAEKSGRADLLEGILYELADWKALAEHSQSNGEEKPAEKGVNHVAGEENPAERWAYQAAYTRLAGKLKEFDNAVRELRKFAEDKAERQSRTFTAAKGLLLNDRPAEGLELLRTISNRRDLLFDVLCTRLEFAAALELAEKPAADDKETFRLDFARARQLCLLGDKRGKEFFDGCGENIKDEIDPEWVKALLKEEIRAGLQEEALAHAAKAMSVAVPTKWRQLPNGGMLERQYLAQLFPQQTSAAEVWWTVLRRQFKDEPPAAVMKRLRQLLEGKAAAKDVKTWIESDQGYREPVASNNVPLRQMQAWSQGLAEGALLAGLDDLAFSLLEKANSRDAFLRLGDLLSAKKQWAKAAKRYQQGWSKAQDLEKQNDPMPLYLAGYALMHAGQEKEGKKLIEQAHWRPFADPAVRYRFLNSLSQRGHKDAARREAELLLCISEPRSPYSGEALRYRAVAALAAKDYLKAAEGFERSILRCFHPTTNFTKNDSLANAPAQIHQLRAMGLLAAGKLDEALKQIDLALTVSPGYFNPAIALVSELERRGHIKESADLFNRSYAAYDKVCRDYPRCALAHNQAAWVSVCCRRNLGEALRHAGKAVELEPAQAGYLDTLAEVHFQRGDKEKAIAVQKRVIALNPKKAYYQKQLKRLEAGDPAAALPPQNDE